VNTKAHDFLNWEVWKGEWSMFEASAALLRYILDKKQGESSSRFWEIDDDEFPDGN
jgi:hypothetical protein